MTTSAFVERRRLRARLALTLSTILCSGLAAPVFAESAHPNLDPNGVDMVDGSFNLRLPVASIGSGKTQLPLVIYNIDLDNWSQISIYRTTSGGVTTIVVGLGRGYDRFTSSDSYAASKLGTGATLTINGDDSITYSTLDGTSINFGNPYPNEGGGTSNFCDDNNTSTSCYRLPLTIDRRGGMTTHFNWNVVPNCARQQNVDDPINCNEYWRLGSVSNDAGYAIGWTYTNATGSPVPAWFQRASATLSNANVSPVTWPTVSYAYPSTNVMNVTTPGGKVWRITRDATTGAVSGVKRPSASSDTTNISYSSGFISSVTKDGVTTNYSRSVSGSTGTTVATNALSQATTIVADLTKQRVTSITDPLSRTTTMAYDSVGRPTEIAYPEGNKVQYAYDSRGNTTTTTMKAKTGSGLSDIVTTANYPSTCTDASCNEPSSTVDARGNQTDYTYDGTTGLLTKVTAPAATSGATRPETRYSYSAVSGVQVVTGVSTCQTGSAPSCVGAADEFKTNASYDSNLNLTSVSTGAGDASLTATTAATYDFVGNLLTVDGPLAGTADITTFRYDADRARIGSISADPDGAGSLKRRALKTTYNSDGQPTVTEIGTVNGTTDTDWAAFVTLQQSTASYDANARKTKDVVTASSTTYGVTQYSYDAVGRLECSALRMNSATWGSLPSSACSLGTTGSYGPDRISKTTFDAAGEATKVQSAYGTSDQADEATGTYNNNGTVATLTDAVGNKTTYEYDGFDRLSKTRYPSTTAGAGTSSTTDYEQLIYDAGSNVTSRRLRGYASDSSQHLDYSYDALNRTILKDLPGSEPDVSYTYDLLSRPLSAATSTKTYSFTYDALGRNLTQTSPFGTTTAAYDLAGQRTFFGWQDGFYVTYDHLVTGETTAIRENGASSGVGVLATFGYDDLGRRTSLTRGNGTTVTYTPDAVSRLSSLVQDLSGTSNDLTLGFSYNPASQIANTTRSNDSYAWSGAANRNDASSVNGLNQVTSVGAGSLGYDVRGNLNSSGSNSYAYSSENLLLTGPSSATLYYDPLMRLYQESGGSIATTLFQYDGQAMIGEYNSSGVLQKRYVHGPGSDEPLIEYDWNGSSFVRTWHHADERGSVIAQSNDSATSTATNTYDEYGVPGTGNSGRFGYTGQAWLPSLGLWYYKARMYSSRLGRFMQTDPIGYGDGMNWYGYVGGDPVNSADPSGLDPPGGDVDTGTSVVTGTPPPRSYAALLLAGINTLISNFSPTIDGAGTDEQDIVVTAKRRAKPCRVSTAALGNSGLVKFKFAEFNASALATSGNANGSFTTANGYSGTFRTSFDGVFRGLKGIGVSEGFGTSQNLSTFSGVNYNVVGTLGPIGISDNYDPNSGKHVGETNGGSTPGLGIGATHSDTTIVTLNCPG